MTALVPPKILHCKRCDFDKPISEFYVYGRIIKQPCRACMSELNTPDRDMRHHWLLPTDYTDEEKQIALIGLERIYAQFSDPIDQLILSLCFELDYPHEFAARILSRSQTTVSTRIKKIKTTLMQTHKSYIRKE